MIIKEAVRNGGKLQSHDSNECWTDKKFQTEINEKYYLHSKNFKRTIKQAPKTFPHQNGQDYVYWIICSYLGDVTTTLGLTTFNN